MKEFDKWCKENGYVQTKDIAEHAWEAALTWILNRVEHANSDGSIISDIEQELLGEQGNNQP